MTPLASVEAECRYLFHPAGSQGSFSAFLKSVGMDVATGSGLESIVRYGWLEPVLRVELPARFILGWRDFPIYPFEGTVHDDDEWACRAWTMGACPRPGWGEKLDGLWYVHPLDRHDCELIGARKNKVNKVTSLE